MLSIDFKRRNLLGSGAYGAVYSGTFDSCQVAVKRMLGVSSTWNQTTLRELVAMCSVPDHPNVMRLEFACIANSKTLFIFPKLKGTLHQHIKSTLPDAERVIKWSSQIIQGVAHMHTHGFIHRDIKLENILLDNNENAYIADLGMARFAPTNCTKPPLSGNVCSLWTRAPELALEARKRYDDRVDSWSVGCVMLAIAAGRYVFRGGSGEGTMSAALSLLGTPEGLTVKGYANKSREEKLISLELVTGRKDLNPIFYATLLDLLVIDVNERKRVCDIASSWTIPLNPLQPRLEHQSPDIILPSQNPPQIPLSRPLYTRLMGSWIWDTVCELGLHVTTAMYALLCWLRLTFPKGQEALFAAACCSLVSRVNEINEIAASTWAKAVGCRLKSMQDAETLILKQTNGQLFFKTGLQTVQAVAFVYSILITTEMSIPTILQIFKDSSWMESETWKTTRLKVPKIAKHAES